MGSRKKRGLLNDADRRIQRTFSDAFKREKVAQIEAGTLGVTELAREIDASTTSIHRWLHQFGRKDKAVQVVVQLESEQRKTQQLRDRIGELERVVGRKQLEIEYLNALLDTASADLGVDVKKTSDTRSSSPSANAPASEQADETAR